MASERASTLYKNEKGERVVRVGHVLQFQQCGVKKTNLLTSILLGDDLFQHHAAKKKTGNVDLKMGSKIWTPF